MPTSPRARPLQRELAVYLAARFGHVSYERVLSGPGLHNVYTFLQQRTDQPDELPDLMKRHGTTDPSAAISLAALANECAPCREVVDLFVTVYGAEAGNLALKFLAIGGVYLGGGIAPKILPLLRDPPSCKRSQPRDGCKRCSRPFPCA